MVVPKVETKDNANPLQEWMDALENRQGEVDLHLEHVALKLPWINEPVELNGRVSVSFHMRELTTKEREARAAKELRALR
ncbi:MAG TPA: hypothetical protein VK424_02275 [Thermoplasmata archaeon]|nr:hypothetical protein [Thermoplasmata archaeon]